MMAQEMEFGLREKDQEIGHLRQKVEACEKREQRRTERMRKEVAVIRSSNQEQPQDPAEPQ